MFGRAAAFEADFLLLEVGFMLLYGLAAEGATFCVREACYVEGIVGLDR